MRSEVERRTSGSTTVLYGALWAAVLVTVVLAVPALIGARHLLGLPDEATR